MDRSGVRCQISRVGGIVRAGTVFSLSVVAVGCGTTGPHRACSVDQLSAYSVTTLEGPQYASGLAQSLRGCHALYAGRPQGCSQ